MGGLSGARIGVIAAVATVVLALGGCGGGNDSDAEATPEPTVFTADEVVAAFEEEAGGYPFEKTTTLVEGATAYAPHNSADVAEVAPLNDALGQGSIVWQVVVFEGADPPLDADAAKEVAFSSKKFDEVSPGIFLGDSDIAYIANGNVVINGPVLDGDIDNEPLEGWKTVLDSL